ncbi:unnamed protein product [Sphagnum jensenii]|uniref:Uncharacterized protein n=1 Tax=Sphagnum jensenii TaxID=128206 RepID=A0ABP0VD47_9BRYO
MNSQKINSYSSFPTGGASDLGGGPSTFGTEGGNAQSAGSQGGSGVSTPMNGPTGNFIPGMVNSDWAEQSRVNQNITNGMNQNQFAEQHPGIASPGNDYNVTPAGVQNLKPMLPPSTSSLGPVLSGGAPVGNSNNISPVTSNGVSLPMNSSNVPDFNSEPGKTLPASDTFPTPGITSPTAGTSPTFNPTNTIKSGLASNNPTPGKTAPMGSATKKMAAFHELLKKGGDFTAQAGSTAGTTPAPTISKDPMMGQYSTAENGVPVIGSPTNYASPAPPPTDTQPPITPTPTPTPSTPPAPSAPAPINSSPVGPTLTQANPSKPEDILNLGLGLGATRLVDWSAGDPTERLPANPIPHDSGIKGSGLANIVDNARVGAQSIGLGTEGLAASVFNPEFANQRTMTLGQGGLTPQLNNQVNSTLANLPPMEAQELISYLQNKQLSPH